MMFINKSNNDKFKLSKDTLRNVTTILNFGDCI